MFSNKKRRGEDSPCTLAKIATLCSQLLYEPDRGDHPCIRWPSVRAQHRYRM